MEKIKIVSLAVAALAVAFALAVFRFARNDSKQMAEKMAKVREAKELKRIVESQNSEQNAEIKDQPGTSAGA